MACILIASLNRPLQPQVSHATLPCPFPSSPSHPYVPWNSPLIPRSNQITLYQCPNEPRSLWGHTLLAGEADARTLVSFNGPEQPHLGHPSTHPFHRAQEIYLRLVLGYQCLPALCCRGTDLQLRHSCAWPWTSKLCPMACSLTSQYGLSPALSPWSCLMIIGLCLASVAITRSDLQIDFLAWPWPCLVTMHLPEALDSWLSLAAICFPWSLSWVRWDWALAGVASALLTMFSCPWGDSWPLLLPDRWREVLLASPWYKVLWKYSSCFLPSLSDRCHLQLWCFPPNYLKLTFSVVSLQILHLFSQAIYEYTD